MSNFRSAPWAAGLAVKLYGGKEPHPGCKCVCGCGMRFVGRRDDDLCPKCVEELKLAENYKAADLPGREAEPGSVEPPADLNTSLSYGDPAPVPMPASGGGKSGPLLVVMDDNPDALLLRNAALSAQAKDGPPLPDDSMRPLSALELDLTAKVVRLEQELDEARVALGVPKNIRLADGIGQLRDRMRAAKRRSVNGGSRAW
jgi:hypothetical protein